mmetsp:Transcript_66561/g.131934  ORF Transcript_66561/g.131934 Transcript_66561/m.131934 type:complete len:88 (-) Transcript_66561:3246-3509(-)
MGRACACAALRTQPLLCPRPLLQSPSAHVCAPQSEPHSPTSHWLINPPSLQKSPPPNPLTFLTFVTTLLASVCAICLSYTIKGRLRH